MHRATDRIPTRRRIEATSWLEGWIRQVAPNRRLSRALALDLLLPAATLAAFSAYLTLIRPLKLHFRIRRPHKGTWKPHGIGCGRLDATFYDLVRRAERDAPCSPDASPPEFDSPALRLRRGPSCSAHQSGAHPGGAGRGGGAASRPYRAVGERRGGGRGRAWEGAGEGGGGRPSAHLGGVCEWERG